jgi:biopolymer transport protein ExbB
MNTSALVDLAGTGATWVLYFLVALSAIQLTVIVERAIAFYRTRAPKHLQRGVRASLAGGSTKAASLAVADARSLEAKVLATGIANADRGPEATQELMRSTMIEERLRMERGMAFLGTVGNNAPFIGLFGTVLGVIHATAELGGGVTSASTKVMSGISEALISTAVGLMVALPAVAAYNYFQRVLKSRATAADALGGELIAHLKTPATYARKAA